MGEDEFAVVYQMGEIKSINSNSGLGFKIPFFNSVAKLPSNVQYLDVKKSEVLTKDKKNYVVDTYVTWQIVVPATFVRSAKSVGYAEEFIDSTVYGITKRVMGEHSQDALIGVGYDSGRDEVNVQITNATNESVKALGIEVLSVKIKALDVPAENESAIYARMISERNQSAESYIAAGELAKSKMINDADREIAIIKAEAEKTAEQLNGEGEAEYMRIWAEAYDTREKVEFYDFIRSLESMKDSLSGDKSKTLILTEGSPITEVISGMGLNG